MDRSKLWLRFMVLIFFGILLFNFVLAIQFCGVMLRNYASVSESNNIEHVKNANFWEITAPILIDDANPVKNWSKTAADNDWCSGSGIYGDPYLIENVTIHNPNYDMAVEIKNSNVYFIIRNCTILNQYFAHLLPNVSVGIKLQYVNNGKLFNNNFSCNRKTQGGWALHIKYCDNNSIEGNILDDNSHAGLFVEWSDNNTILGNSFCNNGACGLWMRFSNNNTISGNTAHNNDEMGICLDNSNENLVAENTANNNKYGISIEESSDNTVTGNTLYYNDVCINEFPVSGANFIEGNECVDEPNPGGIPWNTLFIIIGVASSIIIVSVIYVFKIRKR